MEGFITTTEYAELHGITVQKVDRLITGGFLKYERYRGKRVIRKDAPLRLPLVAPEGYVTVAEFCRSNNVPRTAVDRQIQLGKIPYFNRHNKERWIPKNLQFVKVEYRTQAGRPRKQWAVAS